MHGTRPHATSGSVARLILRVPARAMPPGLLHLGREIEFPEVVASAQHPPGSAAFAKEAAGAPGSGKRFASASNQG